MLGASLILLKRLFSPQPINRWTTCTTALIGAASSVYLSKTINHDPKVEFIDPTTHTRTTQLATPLNGPLCLYAHGWGTNKDAVEEALRAKVLPNMPIAVFNFPDYKLPHGIPIIKKQHLTKTNFGNEDALLVAHLLNKINQQYQPTTWHLHGRSRGGGAILNALNLLGSSESNPLLEGVNITSAQRKSIAHKIAYGTVVLDVPCCDPELALKTACPSFPEWMKKAALWLASRYQPDTPLKPENCLDQGLTKNHNLLVFFQQNDERVGNLSDNESFIKTLQTCSPNAVIREGNSDAPLGGHKHIKDPQYTLFKEATDQFYTNHHVPIVTNP